MGSSALPPETRLRLALALTWIAPGFWSVNYIVARMAIGVVDPYVLAFGRWAIAGALLGLVARSELWRERAQLRAAWRQHLVLGALGMLICGAWVYLGARTAVAMNIALIYACAPILIAVGASLWLGEQMRRAQVLGVALALVGVAHVVFKGQWSALGQVRLVAGDGWIVLATISWAAFALLQKKWPSPLGATARLAAICAGGVLLLLPGALWEALGPQALPWSWHAAALVLTAAIVPGVGAYWVHAWSQRILGASRVAVALYLGPLYTAVGAWALLGEPLGAHHLAGAALILPGVLLVTRSR
jgi:drug/metabolite transporter (DMT)-like permease